MRLSLFDAAREAPEREALVCGDTVISFRELADRARASSQGLRGLASTRVALVAQPDLASVISLHALLAQGLAAVPLHPRWTAEERARALEVVQPVTRLGSLSFAGAGELRALPDDRRPLAILFTSGSTGRPKGVELSRAAFAASADASAGNLGWRDDDRWLLCLPFAHVGGLSILTRCLAARRTVVLPAGPAATPDAMIETIERQRVTLLSLVPAQLDRLLRREPRWRMPSHVRAILVGGAGASAVTLADAHQRGWPVRTTYGLTEACSQVTAQSVAARGEPGSGTPLPGVEVRMVEGAIQVRGPTMFTRYWPADSTPAVDPEGWFTTGDLGTLDTDRRLHVLGRRDDVIVTGGEKVLPGEVEDALRSHEGVAEAFVFGVADATWGQLVAATIVPRAGPSSESALLAHLAGKLAPYKRPRMVAYLPELPANANGKVDRGAAVAQSTPLLRRLG